jgi:hypothetical protein
MRNPIDPTFGLNGQALAILALLSKDERDWPEFITAYTFPFYNGREHAIGLELRKESGVKAKSLVIVFGENRNRDNIFVTSWYWGGSINPPALADMPESAYQGRKSFDAYAIYEASEYIAGLIEKEGGKK